MAVLFRESCLAALFQESCPAAFQWGMAAFRGEYQWGMAALFRESWLAALFQESCLAAFQWGMAAFPVQCRLSPNGGPRSAHDSGGPIRQ